jgi:hypothetical protein
MKNILFKTLIMNFDGKLRILIIFCCCIWITSNMIYCDIIFEDFLFLQICMSYYPCYKKFIATYEIRSLSTITRKGRGSKDLK